MERTLLQSSCTHFLQSGYLQGSVMPVGICLTLYVQDECLYCPVASGAVLCVCNTLVRSFWCTWVILRLLHHSQGELGLNWQVMLLRQKQLMARNSLQKDKPATLEH